MAMYFHFISTYLYVRKFRQKVHDLENFYVNLFECHQSIFVLQVLEQNDQMLWDVWSYGI